MTRTNHITFDPLFDIVADYRGVYMVPSGCTPHHPDQTRLVFRNGDFELRLDQEDETLVRRAAAEGDTRKLQRLLDRFFTPIGRAAAGDWI